MAIKRIVDTNFWNDDKVVEMFSPEDKLFMLYLMTNPHTTQLGIYAINKKIMAFELGYAIETINILLDRFENKYNMIKYSNDTKEIAIKNYLKYSIIKGGKPVEDLLIKEIKQVKCKSLLKYVYDNIKDYEDLNITVNSILELMNNENENNNDNDNDVSYHDTPHDTLMPFVEEVISYLNYILNTKYLPTTKTTIKNIKARLKEGKERAKKYPELGEYTIDDFKEVINKKYLEWSGTEYEKYLTPETLFGNKFDKYLNQKQNISVNKVVSIVDNDEEWGDFL